MLPVGEPRIRCIAPMMALAAGQRPAKTSLQLIGRAAETGRTRTERAQLEVRTSQRTVHSHPCVLIAAVLLESPALSSHGGQRQPREEQPLPEAALVGARVLQLRKMGIQLLWLQPEPEPEQDLRTAGQHTGVAKQSRPSNQLRPCRVAGTVATAEYFFTRGYSLSLSLSLSL